MQQSFPGGLGHRIPAPWLLPHSVHSQNNNYRKALAVLGTITSCQRLIPRKEPRNDSTVLLIKWASCRERNRKEGRAASRQAQIDGLPEEKQIIWRGGFKLDVESWDQNNPKSHSEIGTSPTRQGGCRKIDLPTQISPPPGKQVRCVGKIESWDKREFIIVILEEVP